ncbi:hypothetical protein IWW55_006850, partial [Coemansia sp. RSA 2706]
RTARDRVFADAEFTAKYEKTALETKSKQWVEQNGPVALKRFGVGEQGAAHLSDGS